MNIEKLNDNDLIYLKNYLAEKTLSKKINSLSDISSNLHTKNYKFILTERLTQNYNKKGDLIKGSKIVVLEGSARSGKTISIVDTLIHIGLTEKNRVINIVRGTYNEFKTTLYNDFKNRLDFFQLDNPFSRLKEVKSFKINTTTINFLGADNLGAKLGATSDYLYFNEVIHGVEYEVFKQLLIRTNTFVFCDYNPSVKKHWFFDKVLKRKDVSFLRTTFLDNKFVPPAQKNEILSTEPWEVGSYEIIEDEIFYNYIPVDEYNQPPANKINIENGTADEFYWRVYGLGLRGSFEGAIFKKIVTIYDFPEDLPIFYGNDFGFTTDPNAIVKYSEDSKNIYIQLLFYSPVDNAEKLMLIFESLGIKKSDLIIADSSDRYISGRNGVVNMVSEIYEQGWNISKVSKTKSVMYWLGEMKKKRINLVCQDEVLFNILTTEFSEYRIAKINGVSIEQPVDKNNHSIDAARYCKMCYSDEFFN